MKMTYTSSNFHVGERLWNIAKYNKNKTNSSTKIIVMINNKRKI